MKTQNILIGIGLVSAGALITLALTSASKAKKVKKKKGTTVTSSTETSDVNDKTKQLSTRIEGNDILSFAINLKNKVGKPNFISVYVGDRLQEWSDKWASAKVTMAEFNAMKKFFNEFEGNETDTIKKFSESEKALFSSGFAKLKKAGV